MKVQRIRRRRRGLTIGVAAIVAFGLAGGIAYATIPGPDNVYNACMLKGVGTIRLIDKSLPSSNLMSRCTDKELEVSWNQAGQPGPAGPQGAKGEPGAPGTNGTNGSDGASVLTGRVDGAFISVPAALSEWTRYAEPNGSSEHAHVTNETTRTHLSPNAPIVGRDLVVKAFVSGSGDTATFTLRDDGTDTPLSCTISANARSGAWQSCDSGTATATILAGSELSLGITVRDTTLIIPPVLFAWRATTP